MPHKQNEVLALAIRITNILIAVGTPSALQLPTLAHQQCDILHTSMSYDTCMKCFCSTTASMTVT